MRSPYEPNLFSFLLDALRRSGRNDKALAMVPRALATLDRDNPDPKPHRGATRTCCLVDVLLTHAQAGNHADVIAVAKKYKKHESNQVHAIVAMSQLALGKLALAKAALGQAGSDGLAHHAHAAMLVSQGQNARAIGRLDKAHAAAYPEWHWLAFDPNLAALRELPKFVQLMARGPLILKKPESKKPSGDDIPF